jgi:glycosyltransferase involved in cell wall biosynthesis
MFDFIYLYKRGSFVQKITVVLTTFNRLQLLKRCFEKLLKEKDDVYEIIICDDGSTDETKKYLRQIKNIDKVIVIENNHIGMSNNYNSGLVRATGDYIYIINDDDFISEGMFKEIDRYLQTHVDLVFTSGMGITKNGNRRMFKPYNNDILMTGKYLYMELAKRGNIILTGAIVFKRNLLNNSGYIQEKGGHLFDWELWMNISRNASSCIYINKPLLNYSVGNVGLRKDIGYIETSYWIVKRQFQKNKKFPKINKQYGIRILLSDLLLLIESKKLIGTNQEKHFFNETLEIYKKYYKSEINIVISFLIVIIGNKLKTTIRRINEKHYRNKFIA